MGGGVRVAVGAVALEDAVVFVADSYVDGLFGLVNCVHRYAPFNYQSMKLYSFYLIMMEMALIIMMEMVHSLFLE